MQYVRFCSRHSAAALVVFILSAGIGSGQSVRQLTPGRTQASDIHGETVDLYSVSLMKGQVLRLALEEKGLDLSLEIRQPGGAVLAKSDRHRVWKESITYEAQQAGDFRAAVIATPITLQGSYRLDSHVATVTVEDQLRSKAGRLTQELTEKSRTRLPADATRALELIPEARKLWEELKDREEQAWITLAAAAANRFLGQHDRALSLADEAVSSFETLKSPVGEALARRASAIARAMMSRYDEAVPQFQAALRLFQLAGDRDSEAQEYSNLGATFVALGKTEEAITALEKSVALNRSLGLKSGEASALSNLAWLNTRLDRYEESVRHGERAVAIFQELKQPTLEATALVSLTQAWVGGGDFRKALAACQRSAEIRRSLGDNDGLVTSLEYIANVYQSMGRYEDALAALDQSDAVRATTTNRMNRSMHAQTRGSIYALTSRFDKAIESYQTALDLSRESKTVLDEANALFNLARVYVQLGQDDRAREYAQRSLAIYREANANGAAGALHILGDISFRKGEIGQARTHFEEMLGVVRKGKNKLMEAAALSGLGRVASEVPDIARALGYAEQALKIGREVGDPNQEGSGYVELSAYYIQANKPTQARESLAKAEKLYRHLGSDQDLSTVLYQSARVDRLEGKLQSARAHLEEALQLAESLRARLFNPASRLSWFSTVQQTNRLYVDTLMNLHRQRPEAGFDVLAFEAAERSRARALLDLLRNPEATPGVEPGLAEQERRIARQLDALESQRIRLVAAKRTSPAQALSNEIADLRTQLEQIQGRIRSSGIGAPLSRQAAPLTARQLQAQLDKDTVLLEYMLTPDRSYAWLLDQGTLRSFELPSGTQIEVSARTLYNLVTARTRPGARLASSDGDLSTAVDALSDMVLRPVASAVGSKRLVIVSDGALDYVPFSMLTAPGTGRREPLIVRHELVSLPSASTLAVHRQELASRSRAPRLAAIFADPIFSSKQDRPSGPEGSRTRILEHLVPTSGDVSQPLSIPRLPFSRREAAAIASLIPAEQRLEALGYDATREKAVSGELSAYRYLHFATHGWLDSERPDQSAIVLSLVDSEGRDVDGFLRTDDIYRLRLNADMVTLSACQTGLGKRIEGEGVVGLSRAFLYAGAARVVVSHWNVSDAGTEVLMSDFYRGILRDGKTPSAALRGAQLRMLRNKRWSSPYYWAAFTLHGEWR